MVFRKPKSLPINEAEVRLAIGLLVYLLATAVLVASPITSELLLCIGPGVLACFVASRIRLDAVRIEFKMSRLVRMQVSAAVLILLNGVDLGLTLLAWDLDHFSEANQLAVILESTIGGAGLVALKIVFVAIVFIIIRAGRQSVVCEFFLYVANLCLGYVHVLWWRWFQIHETILDAGRTI